MAGIENVLTQLDADLCALRQRWALVGGLAVSVRAEPRTTRDVDVVIAVADDRQAEGLVAALRARGYVVETVLEQDAIGRLATVRLLAPGEEPGGVIVDLLFASSGAEPEIVASAELLEILPGQVIPVATTGHLIALKILAGRAKDFADVESLLTEASPFDLEQARNLLQLIEKRGYARNQDLQAVLSERLRLDASY